jgi:hypothetical protein
MVISVALLIIAAIAIATRSWSRGPVAHELAAPTAGDAALPAAAAAKKVCGQPVLSSPFNYHYEAGSYSSGTPGLPTFGQAGTNFPSDQYGVVIPTGTAYYASYQLRPYTVYYLEPGLHIGSFMADTGDAFVGGDYNGHPTVLSGQYQAHNAWAIDSNSTAGDQQGVIIEYLTVEDYAPPANAAAINQDSNTGWTIRNNLITLNAPGAGVIAGADNVLTDNCLTLNGQYGFQAEASNAWGRDNLTGGPYNVTVEDNEISYNDTCDFRGLLDSQSIGWKNYNPVPGAYRNAHCGTVVPDGDQGGFKLWQTNNVTIADNYIHNNWGPGAWADTDNANTTYMGNTFTNNTDAAIEEEISYNFSITNNYMADNDWVGGLSNPGFPQSAIYISESGSDTTFGGVPGKYRNQSIISGNTLVNNGGSVFLWQDSNRYCSDAMDGPCTLVRPSGSAPFTVASCRANLPTATVNTATFIGNRTGSPAADYWDGCMWRTENVSITRNVIEFNPAAIPYCNSQDWSDCGAGGLYAEYGSPPDHLPGWTVPTDLTFFQHNVWSDNVYNGPSTFYVWNQGSGDNPINWATWTGSVSRGDKCGSAGDRQSGYCLGPFGQDAGSKYTR